MRIALFLAEIGQDCRFALRILLRARTHALLAICTIGVGIGANTTIFTLVNATLLAPLPLPDPAPLVQVAHLSNDGSVDTSVSVPKYLFVRDHARSFSTLAAYQDLGGSGVNLTSAGEPPERVGATRVASPFFAALGVQPSLGRGFLPDENAPGAARVVVLSDELWARRFQRSPSVLGRSLELNDEPYQVIGVMPSEFRFPEWAELWIPLEIDPANQARHGFLDVVGRLRPGVSIASARAEARLLTEQYRAVDPGELSSDTLHVRSLREALYGSLQPTLLTLLAAVGAVLLVACVNVANLQLARTIDRAGEMGTRVALGATRARIVRQLLVESGVLACAGGLLGLWLAAFLVPLVMQFAPPVLQTIPDVIIDARVLVFTTVASLATVLVFGVLPARALARDSGRAAAPGRGITADRAHAHARRSLIAAEVAIAVVLAAGAGLLARTFVHLMSEDPGFEPEGLVTWQLHFSSTRYQDARVLAATADRIIEEFHGISGVANVALSTSLPFGTGTGMPFTNEGRVTDPETGAGRMRYVAVTPEFFSTMQIARLAGRTIESRDREDAPLVAVINETAAREFWSGASAMGQRITIGQPLNPEIADPEPREIVGIVRDVREFGVADEAPPIVYVPLRQVPPSFAALFARLLPFALTIRTPSSPEAIVSAAEAAVRRADPTMPVTGLATGEQLLGRSLQAERFNAWLMAVLTLVGSILAFGGIYGVVSYLVAARAREIGVRVALGATRGDVLRLLVFQALTPAAVGAVAGVVVAVALSRLLSSLLVGVSPTDPIALGGGALVVLLIAAAAAGMPARRGARVDPVTSLRAQS